MCTSEKSNSESGFSLIECAIAMVFTMVGMLAMAGVIVVGLRMQNESRDQTTANGFIRAKVEQLRNFETNSAARARGGSITQNIANYNDTVNVQGIQLRRRWRVETHPADAGVPANTQRVSVAIISESGNVLLPPMEITTLMPAS